MVYYQVRILDFPNYKTIKAWLAKKLLTAWKEEEAIISGRLEEKVTEGFEKKWFPRIGCPNI